MKNTDQIEFELDDLTEVTSFDFSAVADYRLPNRFVSLTGMVLSGKFVIFPSGGEELVGDPSLEYDYISGLAAEFTKEGTPIVNESADSRSGTSAQEFQSDTSFNQGLYYGYPDELLNWYVWSFYAKKVSGSGAYTNTVRGRIFDGLDFQAYTDVIDDSDYTLYSLVGHGLSSYIGCYCAFDIHCSEDVIAIDDISLRKLDFWSMLGGTKLNSISYSVETSINWSGYGKLPGIFIEMDDLRNPENYIMVEVFRTSDTTVNINLVKCVDKVGSIIDSAYYLDYADNIILKVVRDYDDIFVMYNGAVVIAVSTAILNPVFDGDKYAGVFSTDYSISFDYVDILEASTNMLYASYSTAEAAPLTSPMTCDVGTLVVTDTENKLSISGGQLVCAGGKASPSDGDPGVVSVTFNRIGGLAFYTELNPVLNSTSIRGVGWRVPSTYSVIASFWVHPSGILYADANTTSALMLSNYSAGGNIKLYCILRPTIGAFFFHNIANAGWKLGYVSYTGANTTMIGTISNNNAAFTADETKVLVMKDEFATDWGLATGRLETVIADDEIVMEDNGLVEFTWVAVTGETLNIMIRRISDTNTIIIRCSQSGSTIKIIKKVGGIETELDSDSQTFTNGTSYRIVIACDGASINNYVNGTRKNTVSTATDFQHDTGVKVDKAGTNLVSWPRNVTIDGIGGETEVDSVSAVLLSDTLPEEFITDESELTYIYYDGS